MMAHQLLPGVVNSRLTTVACRSHLASSFVHSTMMTGCDTMRRVVRWCQPRHRHRLICKWQIKTRAYSSVQ